MNTTPQYLAAGGSVAGVAVILLCGLLLTGGLVWSFRLGHRIRQREPAPPRPKDHPIRPRSAPADEGLHMREPNEVPRAEKGEDRLTPHQLGNAPTRPGPERPRPRWNSGSSGSFGGGGGGTA
ncbi:DUF6479 family protein [Streptomyces sp. NPDC047000]|uniref:DUF6479 family protein n=1 Tax=Streptomyces sp. NPDC047000 TaxID=3155474 RepID=UPI0034072861